MAMMLLATGGLGPEFVRHTVDVPEAKISYLVRPGTGPALVLIPGSFNPAAVYARMITRLDGRVPIVIVELPGHGGSWPPPKDGTIPQFARQVLKAVDAAGVKKFYVGGHSIGGMVAIEIAGQRPRALKGVISMEGWTHHSVAEDAFGGKQQETTTVAQLAERHVFREEVEARWTKQQMTEFARIWRTWSGLAILEKTRVPVLEIWGDRGHAPATRAKMQIPERKNIQMVWIHGVSHSLPVVAPEELGDAVNAFLAKQEKWSKQ